MTVRSTRRALIRDVAVLLGSLWLPGLAVHTHAQQSVSAKRVGVLTVAASPDDALGRRFRQDLVDAGYSEGRDVFIDWQSTKGDFTRAPQLVSELIQRKIVPLPTIEQEEDLPPGLHEASLEEVVNQFGQATPQRRLIGMRIKRVHDLVVSTGELRQFIMFRFVRKRETRTERRRLLLGHAG